MKSGIDLTKKTNSIIRQIHLIRGVPVMLDQDLAEIYGVTTKRLNEQVSRNRDRFPEDFMFRLTKKESHDLRSQNATSSWGGRRYPPRVFTEYGAVMLASVLKSRIAVESSILVVRGFIQLRNTLMQNGDLAAKILEMEKDYDRKFQVLFDAIRKLMAPKDPSKRRIGF